MKTCFPGKFVLAGVLAVAPVAPSMLAQDVPSAADPAPASQSEAQSGRLANSVAPKPSEPAVSKARGESPSSDRVQEILRMADAKVSPEVIKTYILSGSVAYTPSAADIIALKEHNVGDDITTALMKRSAELTKQPKPAESQPAARSAPAKVPAPVVAVPAYSLAYPGYVHLDPEGYDFFRYYYLHPRTLEYVGQRLSPYYAPSSFSYYRSYSVGPYFRSGYVGPGRDGFHGRRYTHR